MAQTQTQRHTVFDAMEKAGVFALNPANESAKNYETGERLYKGPVKYPMMLYHPKGELRQIVPPNFIVNPVKGPIETDTQMELIYAVVEDEEQEKKLLGEGWHTQPSHAHAVRNGEPIPKTAVERATDLEADNAKLRAQLAELQKNSPSGVAPKK